MNRQKALIVEDDPAIAQLLSINLRHHGFDPACVSDGAEAQNALETSQPDVILLDWTLPGENGPTLAKRWRQQEHTKSVPLIMMTARGDEGSCLLGLNAGADDFVRKPFSPRELISRIRAVIRSREGAKLLKPIAIGEIRLDPGTYRVSWKDRPVTMGNTEFKVLQHLMRHAGRVQTRGMLLDGVWGNDAFIDERTVDVHIKRLRESLGEASKMIQTIRGSGYILAEVQ